MIDGDGRVNPAACARRHHLLFEEAISAIELRSKTALLLAELAGRLAGQGDRLIGHIKGLIDAGENGHLFFSITSFEEGLRLKGELLDGVTEAALTVNVIVYGFEEGAVEEMLEEAFTRHFDDNRSPDDRGEGHAQ
jgi:hypothetical protein